SKEYGLQVIVPINEAGDYLPGFGSLSGRNIRETNPLIFQSLREQGVAYRLLDYTHRYPTCWRCGQELAFRLADEWFIRADEIREPMKAAAATVNWVPPSAGKRMEDWLGNMGDWNISRKRYWGLPLPFYPCSACGKLTVIGTVAELRGRATSGLEDLKDLHRPWIDGVRIRCECGAEVERIVEVGDAWLDAGIVPFSTLNYLHDRPYWEQWFPADFITEMREQIRLWFYSMLFMSVTLRDESPYRQVLAYEKLMDELGKPMHKSLGNAIWFDEAAERMGADVMRWLYASQSVQLNLNFGYGPAEEVKRRLLTLWNVYSFFVLYARLDGFDPVAAQSQPVETTVLDRWVIARLNDVVERTREGLERFDAAGPVRQIERFVDDLSNWYVRRSRPRFWKAEADGDKRAAFLTLHTVLETLCRLLAPFMPFLTESMYQNLARSVDAGAEPSVHLAPFPEPSGALVNAELMREMELARRIASLAHAIRKREGLRVRQPLAAIRVAGADLDLAPDVLAQVADEVNVKRVDVTSDLGQLAVRRAALKPAVLGPKYGARFKSLLQAVREGDYRVLDDGRVVVGDSVLESDEVEIRLEAASGYAVAQEGGLVVALDVSRTPELIDEGRAREVVHRVQQMRKDAGFEISDRIELRYAGDAEIVRALERYRDYVSRETLTVGYSRGGSDNGYSWRGQVDELPLELSVCKASE
ncbi:MAG: class I tRNA ligase family protein, partial [Chloroflexi bacterium]|nr:class I tRNA ligase family protein [Chloroflexota bacterium]